MNSYTENGQPFCSDFQLIRWSSPTLGRTICCTQPINLNVKVVKKYPHRNTLWAHHGSIKLTLSLSARKEFQIQTSILSLSEQNKEKAMATHSSSLAWKIPWTEEPGRLQSMGLRRVRHDWATSLFTFMRWRRKWQPTPVFLPGGSQGWGGTESDTTEVT